MLVIAKYFDISTSGIQTYLNNVVKHWSKKNIIVYCGKSKFKTSSSSKNMEIILCKTTQGNHLKNCFAISKLMLSNFRNIFSSIIILLILFVNRNALNRILGRLNEIVEYYKNNVLSDYSVATLVVPEGVISVILKLKYQIPAIILLQGSELIHFNGKISNKILINYIFRKADIIVANSNYMKEFLKNFVKNLNNVIITHLGVDNELFFPTRYNEDLAKTLNIPKKKKIILSVSNLVYRKGIDCLLKALAIVKENYEDFIYIAVGGNATNEYKITLDSIIDTYDLNDYVIWVGAVAHDDLAPFYNLCDFFVLPARDEAFGLVTLEANACRKTVIGSATGGIKETIIDDVTGLLFEPENENDLAEKILTLLKKDKLTEKLSKNAYERTISEYTWSRVIEKLQKIIENKIYEFKN